ncbi:MAG: hypothetical protein QOD71_1421 [Thermoleophilaceae bacterium]|jgi:hypothetical protein|nr:hypothetical protein [Thermoleophilaceae bacterium]
MGAVEAWLRERAHRQVIDPAPVAVVADHRSREKHLGVDAGQHRRRRSAQSQPQVLDGVVPRARQADLVPKLDGRVELGVRQWADQHG